MSFIATGSSQQCLGDQAKPSNVETATHSRVLLVLLSAFLEEGSIKGVGSSNEPELQVVQTFSKQRFLEVFYVLFLSQYKRILNKMLLPTDIQNPVYVIAAFQSPFVLLCDREKSKRIRFRPSCPIHCKNRYKSFCLYIVLIFTSLS